MTSEWRTRGYLPHYDVRGTVQHVVFCLADALPVAAIRHIAEAPPWERSDVAEGALDAGAGDRLLADARAAAIVEEALLHFDARQYALKSWCVMPTHVHVLAEMLTDSRLDKVVQSWKSFSAHAINKALGRSGRVWFREYFDRAIRDEQHLGAVIEYIERNPVAAGLCGLPEDWRWSSACSSHSRLPGR